ncbi:MAG: PqqD family protein [Oscillospiraceae bacterium]|nr:PqqD family protein [Oscillospiraceae bacterium]
MKLKKDFIVHRTEDECLIVPLGGASFSGMVRGNESSGVIFDCLNNDTTIDAIVKELMDRYEAPEETVRNDVNNVINKLKKIGALEM